MLIKPCLLCSQLIWVWSVQNSRDCEILLNLHRIFYLHRIFSLCSVWQKALPRGMGKWREPTWNTRKVVNIKCEKRGGIQWRGKREWEAGANKWTSGKTTVKERILVAGAEVEGRCAARSRTGMLMGNIGAKRSNVLRHQGLEQKLCGRRTDLFYQVRVINRKIENAFPQGRFSFLGRQQFVHFMNLTFLRGAKFESRLLYLKSHILIQAAGYWGGVKSKAQTKHRAWLAYKGEQLHLGISRNCDFWAWTKKINKKETTLKFPFKLFLTSVCWSVNLYRFLFCN